MDDALRDNQALWDAWTKIHVPSAFYDVASFRDGTRPIRLSDYEREEVGPVEGRSLLHLQCHFGLDTLSWARLGARVTGLDFSAEAVAAAQALAADVGLEARFVQSNVYDAPEALDGTFDIVYTSRGVLGWLPDIAAWARVVAHFVRPGGTFYVTEIHPVAQVFEDEGVAPGELRLRYPYWSHTEPISFDPQGSYADPTADTEGLREHGWDHSLGEIVTALIDAGLRIDFLHELPFVEWPVAFLVEGEDDRYRLPAGVNGELPLFFSIRATKPAPDAAGPDRGAVRRHAAGTLHDEVGQSLTAAYRFVEAARAAPGPADPPAKPHLDAARDQLLVAMRQLRVVMDTLAPSALEARGLGAAIREWAERVTNAGARVRVLGDVPSSTAATDGVAFDLVTEAVRLARGDDDHAVEVTIRTDGDRRIMHVTRDVATAGIENDPGEGWTRTIGSIREAANDLGGAVDVEADASGRRSIVIELPSAPPVSASGDERGQP